MSCGQQALTENARDRRSSQEDKDETNDIVAVLLYEWCADLVSITTTDKIGPTYQESQPGWTKQDGNNKVPSDTVNSSLMSGFEPLVDDETAKEEVDEGPDVFNPVSYSMVMNTTICLLYAYAYLHGVR